MHLVTGIVQILLAHALAIVYRGLRFDWLGCWVVHLCCAAFVAGAGLDDAAVAVVRNMGPNGVRLLEQMTQHYRHGVVASLMLDMLRVVRR